MLETIILIVAIILLLTGVCRAIYNKTVKGVPLILICIGLMSIFIIVTNSISQKKKIVLGDATLQQIAQIDWTDNKNLSKIGFEEFQGDYRYYGTYTINVEKAKQEPKNISLYEDFKYEFSEKRNGIFYLPRLWEKELSVTRSYYIYVDGLQISLFEHTSENSPYAFSNIISEIIEKQTKKTGDSSVS